MDGWLTFASACVALGTGLQLAASADDTRDIDGDARFRDFLRWFVDPVVWKNDKSGEHRAILRGRAFRRRRTGWLWLTLGTTLTFFYTFIGWLGPE